VQEFARLTEKSTGQRSDKTHIAIRHAIEMSKISHILSTVCTDDRSYDLFAEGIDELKKVVIKDLMDRIQQKTQATQKRRKVDDPVQVYADGTQDDQGSNKFDADLNQPPPPDNIEPTIDINEDATGSFKDPPISTNPGFNLGERPKSMYEKSARKLQKRKHQGYADCADSHGIQGHFVQTETR
jgi:hypothetical protein